MLLYKFLPNGKIAEQVSIGVFRFYELTKYIGTEDNVGRSDAAEGSITFPDDEWKAFPYETPIASYNGVEFRCISINPSKEYLRQYFVFCMSTEKSVSAIGDSKYAVELNSDIFEFFEMLLRDSSHEESPDGLKFFSHGKVEYYDIHDHPENIRQKRWREVYSKHKIFSHQREYRAALFVHDHFFAEIREEPLLIENEIYGQTGHKMGFNLKLHLRAGIDDDGWRFIEFDVTEFSRNLVGKPSIVYAVNQ